MKLAFFCFVLFALCAAQTFEASRVQLETIALVEDQTQASATHNEYVDDVSADIATNECRNYFHPISSVRTSGFQNSGTYFKIDFTVSVGSVTYSLQYPDDGEALDAINGNDQFTCTGSCSHDFYCEIYDASSSLELVVVSTTTGNTELSSYGVTVRQYTDAVPDIPRSFQQNSAIGESYVATNLGPENFVHFHHTLDATVAELSQQSTMYIAVTVPATVTGTGYICVSDDALVGNTDANPGVTNAVTNGNFDLEGDHPATATIAPCSVKCAQGTFGVEQKIYISYAGSTLCSTTDLWIGIRLPTDTTFEIDITFENVPPVTFINQAEFQVEGRLTDNVVCGNNNDYSCNAFYVLTASTIAALGGNDQRVGPVIDIEAYGAINGDFRVILSTGLNGQASGCGSVADTCTFNSDGGSQSSCHIVLETCDINTNEDYVITVISQTRDSTDYTADFGLNIHVEQFPIIAVDVNSPQTLFGSVIPGHYNHYEIELSSDDIFTDSWFEAEMYPENPVNDVISFMWNFNSIAGNNCFDNSGICSTGPTTCTDYDNVLPANSAKTFCRFLYLPCPISEGVSYYNNPNLARSDRTAGEKVSELQAGTYYFAVWSPSGNSDYQVPDIKYTLNFAVRRSIPLYENVVTLGSVYFLDYSRQYVLTIPDDPTIGTINIVADNVRNGIVRFYVNCGALAGDCPCWANYASCAVKPETDGTLDTSEPFTGITDLNSCVLRVPRCACSSNQLYIAARGALPGGLTSYNENQNGYNNNAYSFTAESAPVVENDSIFGFDQEKPATFTLAAFFHLTAGLDEIEEIFASRAGVTVIDNLSPVTQKQSQFYSTQNLDAKYYSVKFDTLSVRDTDALFVTLVIGRSASDSDFVVGDSSLESIVTLAIGHDFIPDLNNLNTDPVSGCAFDFCDARADLLSTNENADYTYDMSTCSIVYQPCSDRCASFDRSFNSNIDYIIAVVPIQSASESAYLVDEYFSVQVQVVDQAPKVISGDFTFWGGVRSGEYLHFSYDVAGTPANSRLIIELYQDDKQQSQLSLFANYFDGEGEPVFAGRTQDCYEHMFCEVCTLSGDRQNKCIYDIPACQLSTQNGVYYVSVASSVVETYNYATNYVGPDGQQDPTNPGPRNAYSRDTNFGKSFFTLNMRVESITPLLVNSVPVPVVGSMLYEESSYYSVTIPATSGTIVGRILNLEFLSYNTDLSVFLSGNTPDQECPECIGNTVAAMGTILRFRRSPCERNVGENTYYLSVSASTGTFDQDCERAEFAVSAKIEDIIQTSISLTAQNTNTRIPAIYDSSVGTNTPFRVSSNEFRVVEFPVSASEGEFLVVTVTMDVPDAGNLESGPFDVFLANGDFALPNIAEDDFNFGTSVGTCTAAFDSCMGVTNGGTECKLIVLPCQLPEDNSAWYLTFSGESISEGQQTANINVVIEKFGVEPTVNVPASDSTSAETTTLTFDGLEEYYSYRSVSTLGLAAGESLTFSLSAPEFYVQIAEETDGTCDSLCDNSSPCVVRACSSVSARTFFFFVRTTSTTSATLSIQRTIASDSNTNIQPLSANGVIQGPFAIQSSGGTSEQFQYFSLNIPASTTASRYSIDFSGSTANLFSVDSPTFFPNPTAVSADTFISSDLSLSSNCGNPTPYTLPSGDCCYDQVVETFVVSGESSAFTFTITTENLVGNTRSFSTSGSVTDLVILGNDQVDLITFSVNAGDDLFFDFEGDGTTQLFLNSGTTAGSGNVDPATGYCFANLNVISSVCVGNPRDCSGTIHACDFQDCQVSSSGTNTFTFGITGSVGNMYSLTFASYTPERDVSSSTSTTLSFPLVSTIDDVRTANDQYALYTQYVYTFTDTPSDLPQYVPTNEATLDPALAPRVTFTFDNFRDSTAPNTQLNTLPLSFYIGDGQPAEPTCFTRTDLVGTRSFLPCIGGGVSTLTSIECAIDVCDIGCGRTIYFGVAREPGSPQDILFDFSAVKSYSDYNTADQVENLVLTLSGTASAITRPNTDDDAIVFVRVTSPSVNAGDYPIFTVTPTGVDVGTTIRVDAVSTTSDCSGVVSSPDTSSCTTVSLDEACLFQGDACTSEFSSIDPLQPTFYRITRTAGAGAWGFTFAYQIIDISAIDSSQTTLSSTGNTDYSATKEINDFTWHFYNFNINENDGYSSLTVSVDNVNCESTGTQLEIYANWGSQAVTFDSTDATTGRIADSHLPDQWPSSSCDLSVDNTVPWTSVTQDTCQFNAGGYRVGIFAPRNAELFPDPQFIETNNQLVPIPVTYSISASLNSLSFVTMSGCSLIQENSQLVRRVEIPIGASNRGSSLSFTISSSDDSDTVHLIVSANSYPQGRTASGFCSLDDTDEGVYSCSNTESCEITIDRCAFVDGVWYAYIVDEGESGDITISYSVDSTWIPVIDAIANSGDIYSGRLAVMDIYQYYKIVSDTTFIVDLQAQTCTNGNCDIEMNIFAGARGHGFNSGLSLSDCNEDCSCGCNESFGSCSTGAGDCPLFIQACNWDTSDYFVGLRNSNTFDATCSFDLTVTSFVASDAVVLSEDAPLCVSNPCVDLYSISNIATNQYLTVTVNDGSESTDDMALYFGSSLSCLSQKKTIVSGQTDDFVFGGCSSDLTDTFYVLIVKETCVGCSQQNTGYSISYSLTNEVVATVSTNSPFSVSADYATFTSSVFVASSDSSLQVKEDLSSVPNPADTCFTCSTLLAPGSYMIQSPVQGTTLTPLSITSVGNGSPLAVTIEGSEYYYFSYTPAAGVKSISVQFSNVHYSPFDFNGGDISSITDLRFTNSLFNEGCSASCSDFGTALGDSCDDAFNSLTFDVCGTDTIYFTLSYCGALSCPIELEMTVTANAVTSSTFVAGGNHRSQYQRISADAPDGCSASPNLSFYTTVSDVLLVSVRQPGSVVSTFNVGVSVSPVCGSPSLCNVDMTDAGIHSSCSEPQVPCSSGHCVSSGDYIITFAPSAVGPYEFEYQVITQYIELSGTTTDTIIGDTSHFYRITDVDSALAIALTVTRGPALNFAVIGGCEESDDLQFVETKMCAFGTCHTWIPTKGKQTSAGNLYVVLESSSANAASSSVHQRGEINVDYEKETVYSLSVTRGAANCGSVPTSGFCADPTRAGINVWSDVSNSVWTFGDVTGRDAQAECLYNDLVARCVAPSTECKQFLKAFACVSTFPQCDADGYQMGVCRDLCLQVEDVCGEFLSVASTGSLDSRIYDCASPRYQSGSTGTCYENLPVTIIPVETDPLSFFDDDDDFFGLDPYGLPGSIEVPEFAPIYATIPAIVNDDDDGVGLKMFEQSVVEDNSSASCLSMCFISFLLFIALF